MLQQQRFPLRELNQTMYNFIQEGQQHEQRDASSAVKGRTCMTSIEEDCEKNEEFAEEVRPSISDKLNRTARGDGSEI